MRRLLHIFESKYATAFCIIFAIANRIIFATLYSQIGTDTKIQLTYAQNLMSGKGMGVTKYFTNNPDKAIVDTQQMFPPGFSLTIIPFLKLSGNEFDAVLIFDIFSAIIFVFAVRLLGKKTGLSPALNNILTIIAGCSQFLFFMSWSSTDTISLCFLLFSLTATIGIISKKNDLSFLQAVGFGALFCLPFFFRYMYLPVAALFPFLVLSFGFLIKNKILRSAGIKLSITTFTFLFLLFAFNIYVSGNALFVHDFGRGIFVDQLTKWYPFLPASFINLDFFAQLVERISGLSYSRFMLVMEIINPIFLLLFVFLLFKFIAKNKYQLAGSAHSLFIITGAAVAITILLLLTYLTLTYKAIPWGYIRWTHSQHARYFAYFYIFIPMLLFVCLQHYKSFIKNSLISFLMVIALSCITIEALHGVYYNVKIIISHKDLNTVKNADKGYRNFSTIIAEIKQKYPDSEVLVSSPDQYYLHAASQMGYKAIFDYENLHTDFRTSAKSILIMPVHAQEAIIMKEYIENKKPPLYKLIAGTYFYTEEISLR